MKVNSETYSTTWTTQADFENNAVVGPDFIYGTADDGTLGTATTRSQVDTSSSPGDVKLEYGQNWTNQNPATAPSVSGVTHAMAYDSLNNKVVLFGGNGTWGWYRDTWVLDNIYLSQGTIGESGTGLRINAGAGIRAKWLSLDWAGSGLSPNYRIGFQIRAYDSFGGGSYVNPSDGGGEWYETISGTSGNIPIHPDVNATPTQTLEIKVQLTSDGANTPVLSSLTLNYEAPPASLDYSTWRSN